jgi:hypothetical protein
LVRRYTLCRFWNITPDLGLGDAAIGFEYSNNSPVILAGKTESPTFKPTNCAFAPLPTMTSSVAELQHATFDQRHFISYFERHGLDAAHRHICSPVGLGFLGKSMTTESSAEASAVSPSWRFPEPL